MLRGFKYLALLVLGLAFSTCKKEKKQVPESNSDCLTYPEVNAGAGFDLGFKGYHISHVYTEVMNPIFNPTNENEFIYSKKEFDTTTLVDNYSLWKFNLETGNSIKLLAHLPFEMDSPIVFTSDGRIVYVVDRGIFSIMDADGNNQQKFHSFGMNVSNLIINRSMSKMVMSWVIGASSKTVLYYLDGSQSDTFFYGVDGFTFLEGDFSGTDSIATLSSALDYFGVSVVDLAHDSMIPIFKKPVGGGERTRNVKWHPDNETLFFTNDQDGIYKYKAGQLTLVKPHCDNKMYGKLSISPSGQKMVVERYNRTKISDTRLEVSSHIAIMNIDGTEEQVLDLE
ncbi:MAG: hypothetical protein GC180_07870 [Bacteroidetes bacterium]|nr:hypothetical protein [Bacteroidota bacterium]